MATVAQTKSGFCLQFEWIDDDERPFYCSVDIVPVFPIKQKAPMELARVIITALRKRGHPLGWFHQLRKYEVCDKILEGRVRPIEEFLHIGRFRFLAALKLPLQIIGR